MADQTIEIKLILRDELSKQLAPIIAQLNQLNAINLGRANEQMQTLGKGVQAVHRELSTLARIGFGGLIGGGVVAGIVATGKALSDMAGKGLQLRYTADSLGVSTDMLNQFSDAMMGLGKSQEEGAAGIQSATKALRELQVEGRHSSLFKQLEQSGGETGRRIGYELLQEVTGPRGAQGALVHALQRMAGMRQESAAKFGSILGFGPGFGRQAARDYLEVLGQLPRRLELSHRQQLDLAKANASLEMSWDNIKTTLASALIPTFARLIEALDAFLQSPDGEKFTKQLEAWGKEMNDAVDAWLKGGGMGKAATELRKATDEIKSGFVEADKIITSMGLSWPKVIGAIVGLKLGAELASIATALLGISRIPGIGPMLIGLAAAYGAAQALKSRRDRLYGAEADADPSPGRKPFTMEDIQTRLGAGGGTVWDRFRQRGGGSMWRGFLRSMDKSLGIPMNPLPGENTPKTESEQRGDAAQKKRETRELIEEFRTLTYDLAKLNDYIMPGGPEGGGGASGFQFDTTSEIGPAGRGGKHPRPWPTLPAGATPLSAIPGTPRPAQTSGTGFASWYGNRPDIGFRDREDQGRQGVSERNQGIALGSTATLGDWHYLTDPHSGLTHVVQQTDTGPNIRTQKLLDIHASQLARMGYDAQTFPSGRGLWGVQPAFPSFAKESSGLDYRPNYDSGITQHLASRDTTSVNGSATVDIDVGGASEPGRDPSSLFRRQPLGGVQQMQNVTQPPSNPLSFN